MTFRYDFDQELEYRDIDGVSYRIGTAGSFILVCPVCGHERFRQEISQSERCWEGHDPMEPLTADNMERYRRLWLARGDSLTIVEERRAERLHREANRGR